VDTEWLRYYGCADLYLRTNKFLHILYMIVFSGVILKRNY